MKNPRFSENSHKVLPGPYAKPSVTEVKPTPAVLNLARSQVRALLEASPSFRDLDLQQQKKLAHNLVKVAAYSAALVQDEMYQSQKLGQTPVLRKQTILEPMVQAVGTRRALPSTEDENQSRALGTQRSKPFARRQEFSIVLPIRVH